MRYMQRAENKRKRMELTQRAQVGRKSLEVF